MAYEVVEIGGDFYVSSYGWVTDGAKAYGTKSEAQAKAKERQKESDDLDIMERQVRQKFY